MNKRRRSKVGMIVIIGLLAYFIWILFDQQRVIYSIRNEQKISEAKLEEEKKYNEELKNQKKTIESDEFIERVVREKFGMVKKGERIFLDADNASSNSSN